MGVLSSTSNETYRESIYEADRIDDIHQWSYIRDRLKFKLNLDSHEERVRLSKMMDVSVDEVYNMSRDQVYLDIATHEQIYKKDEKKDK